MLGCVWVVVSFALKSNLRRTNNKSDRNRYKQKQRFKRTKSNSATGE